MDKNLWICHRSPLLGKERKDHKYVARVLLKKGSGKKPNQYRYFYDNKSYQEYLSSQKNVDSKSTTISNVFNSSKTKQQIKESVTKGKSMVNTMLNKKSIAEGVSNSSTNRKNEVVNRIAQKINDLTIDALKKKDDANRRTATLPNGKRVTFNTKDEYDDYKERLEYQKNEPDFMKKVPKISDNIAHGKLGDMDKVNETYDPYEDSASKNCANCSVAYELRRRGYDVEAKDNGGENDYNGRGDRFYDYFENAEVIGVYGDGGTFIQSEEYTRYIWKRAFGEKVGMTENYANETYPDDFTFNDNDYEVTVCNLPYANYYDYSVESIEKAIKSNNPPGSRGMIDVEWKTGGAHSIVYDVDDKGKVTIRDSQTCDEYGLDELASRVSKVRICRTDNLELKEGILNAVEANEDKKRHFRRDGKYLITETYRADLKYAIKQLENKGR